MGFRNFLLNRGIMSSDNEVMIRAGTFGRKQAAPVAMTTSATITVAALLNGIIIGTHAASGTQAYTMPTGALIDAALTSFVNINDSFDFHIINLSAADGDSITLTASTGVTIVGSAVVNSNEFEVSYYRNTGMFRVRKTAADTFVVYRIA